MSTDIAPVPIDATLVEAARQMRSSGAGGLPVLDPEGAGCAGILTERDVVVRALAEGRDARRAIIRDVATLEPVICAPNDMERSSIGPWTRRPTAGMEPAGPA